MNTSLRAHGAILVANIIYGANYSIAKVSLPFYIPAQGYVLLRVFVSLILFHLLQVFLRAGMPVERKDHVKFFQLGLFGVAINQLLFFKGLALTSNINAALIMTANPILVLIVAAFILRERITGQRVIGIALGVGGAAFLILRGTSTGISSLAGDTMIFFNALSYAIYLVLVKPLMAKYNAWVVIKWTFFYGFFLIIPFGWKELSTVEWGSFTLQVWLSVVYVIIFSTFLAYLLNTYGLKYLSPAVVSFYIYLQPVFATLISIILAQEEPALIHALSCLLIFTGVFLVSGPPLVRPKS